VLLVTSLSLRDADWPRESIDEIYYVPDDHNTWKREDAILGVSHLARTQQIDRIVPLDDFDLETAAAMREHLRIPGLGESATRFFRDKLAMRVRAKERKIRVPEFVHVLNEERIREFIARVPAPWLLKPRGQAGAIGIRTIDTAAELWPAIAALGDRHADYLLERFVPGDMYHVDSIVHGGEVLWARASRYGHPPLDVMHNGGIFTTRTLSEKAPERRRLESLNAKVLDAMELPLGVSHTEFLRAHEDGALYFIETSARVGGAHIAELLEAASGINLWSEWAKLEISAVRGRYRLPKTRDAHGGLLVSLTKEETPDLAEFDDPEVVWRLAEKNHLGVIVASGRLERIEELLDRYAHEVRNKMLAVLPPPARATM
jgi:biotin carboxylase